MTIDKKYEIIHDYVMSIDKDLKNIKSDLNMISFTQIKRYLKTFNINVEGKDKIETIFFARGEIAYLLSLNK